MNEEREKEQNRREFFAGLLRYSTLGLLGAISGAVFVKRGRLLKDGICVNQGICKGCRIFDQCDLPLAVSEKHLIENQ